MLELIAGMSLFGALVVAATWFVVWRREQSPEAQLAARSWRRYRRKQEQLRKAERDRG